MAKAKKSSPKKDSKNKPSKKAPAAEEAQAAVLDASHVDAALKKFLAQHPAISDAQRAAYSALIDPEQADELGKRTRAADVRDEAIRWAAQMDGALRMYPGAFRRYSPARFVHFLECTRTLHKVIRAEDEKRSKVKVARGTAESERQAALDARKDVISALRTYAGQRPKERQELKQATGVTDSLENLAKSIAALVALGQRWLGRQDETSKILATEANLTADVLQAATDAAAGLGTATADALAEGHARSKDTPPINRAEGRVLLEMLEARRIWNEAHERSGLVQKLNPGPAIRHVFGRSPSADDGTEVEEEPSAAPPA
jgi:hypothetical protein